ncbi:glycoside hydrolase family 2 protein [Leeuwenhoekiella sp. UBA6783]|uniref:glycoside hydrolase family 2 protein n=1 Tax=Leeuwenhoekiella sp. UBA6783 TaxID=1946747 RepID=UPI0025C52110|nr:glycoside hydrolase family 2 TIM barrel-domain containing protein [Leeuwenhoekiella sp. UBA6783]|tara:strand:+ start:734 stop:2545 length:1812 start_codon:yes stop_codon:yes gene_type:complete
MLRFLKIFLLLLPFTQTIYPIYSQEIFINNTINRSYESLNGKWEYILDPYNTGGMGGAAIYQNKVAQNKTDRVEFSFDQAKTLYVPGSFNAQSTELSYFEGTVWYKRTFNKPENLRGKRYFINFGAANYKTAISFNGQILGHHEGGFTPFSYEITDLIKDTNNYLIVGVDAGRSKDYIPSEVTDWFNYGGITRDVKLIATEKPFINNYFIALDKTSLNSKTKRLFGKVQVNGVTAAKRITINIPELDHKEVILVSKNGFTSFAFEVDTLELWSPESPKLYEVILETDEEQITDQIGFRTIETLGREILLNGKPVFLKGICLHDENPFKKDRANTPEDAELVLHWAEELGCNFIRLAHYPHQEHIVRLADKKGILLWEELPLYWGIQWGNDKVLEKAKDQYDELINRDYNRASSIIWSIANETAPGTDRNAFLSELADYIRSKDSTRLISAAVKKDQELDGHPDSVYTYNDPIIEKLDIISINEYLGWYGGLPEESRNKSFTTGLKKPIIVSEFGGGALKGYHGDKHTRWSEEFQENLYKESLAMFDKIEGLAGMTPWILVDFKSPLRQLRGVQDGWNRKGLISETGAKKKAFYILQTYYNKKP